MAELRGSGKGVDLRSGQYGKRLEEDNCWTGWTSVAGLQPDWVTPRTPEEASLEKKVEQARHISESTQSGEERWPFLSPLPAPIHTHINTP